MGTKAQHKHRESAFIATLGRELPHLDIDTVTRAGERFLVYARRAAKLLRIKKDERVLFDREQKELDKTLSLAINLAEACGCRLYFIPDANVVCMRLLVPSGYTDDYDHIGVRIPEGFVPAARNQRKKQRESWRSHGNRRKKAFAKKGGLL